MAENSIKFYNMLIHFIRGNKLFEENCAIKNIWEKEDNIFLDIYFYRKRKSYIFDAVFIHDITDLSTEKYYINITDFMNDFSLYQQPAEDFATSEGNTDKNSHQSNADKKIFEIIEPELIIMAFMAKSCDNYSPIKTQIIYDYIISQIPQTANLSKQYIDNYIDNLNPDEQQFYQTFSLINYQKAEHLESFCKELLKLCLADGRMHYKEKLFFAEFLQNLREAGIVVDLDL